jgi:hypothetical protein
MVASSWHLFVFMKPPIVGLTLLTHKKQYASRA